MKHKQARLADHEGIHVRLTCYGAASGMDTHSHDYNQLSFLLAGAIRERHGCREIETALPSVGFKPAGLDHANDYGRDGAVILSLNITPEAMPQSGLGEDWRWRPRRPDRAIRALLGTLDGGGISVPDTVTDLLAAADLDHAQGDRRPEPDWLRPLRDRLDDPRDEAEFSAMAREAGVHRVVASRRFAEHYALPPSLYRLRRRLSHALGLIGRGHALAAAAAEAGFADQAHLSRTMRRELGSPPSVIRDMLRAG